MGCEIITDMNTLTEDDFGPVEWEDTVTAAEQDETAPIIGESLRPKFDSVAAFKLHQWSLFRNVTDSNSPNKSEQPAAILHTDPQGFVSAEWYGDGNAAEEVWNSLTKEWEEFEDANEDDA